MLKPDDQQPYARDAIKEFLKDVECQNNKELAVAGGVLISRIAMLLASRIDSDTAQCALYTPYKALLDKDNKNAV